MAFSDQHPLYLATRRLTDALDRLEQNMQRVAVAHDRGIQQEQQLILFQRENNDLVAECNQLNTALSDLQQRYDMLHDTASVIHKRLDDSIRRLTQIIDE